MHILKQHLKKRINLVRETKQTTENLVQLRQEIDEIDNELLGILARQIEVLNK